MARIYQARTVRSILRDHDRQLKVQGSASVLARSGLSATAEDEVTMYGDFIVTGNFTAQGKISNDALMNPTKPGTIYASTTNFSLPVGLANILTVNVTVPSGFTTAHVSVAGRVFAFNNTAGLDYLYGQTNIAGYNGYALPLAVSASGGSGTNNNSYSVQLDGLTPGGSFAVQMAAGTSFAAWAANTGNTAELSGSITWYR